MNVHEEPDGRLYDRTNGVYVEGPGVYQVIPRRYGGIAPPPMWVVVVVLL